MLDGHVGVAIDDTKLYDAGNKEAAVDNVALDLLFVCFVSDDRLLAILIVLALYLPCFFS